MKAERFFGCHQVKMYLNCLFRFISFLTSLESVVLCLNHSLTHTVNQIPCPSLSPVLWKNPNPIYSSSLLTLYLNSDSAWLEKMHPLADWSHFTSQSQASGGPQQLRGSAPCPQVVLLPRVGSSSFSAAFSSFLACCLSLSPDCDLVFFVSFFCLFVCFYYEKRSCKKKIYLHTTRPTSLPPYIVPRLPSSYRGKREDLVYSCTWSCYRQFFILAGLFLAIYKLKKKKNFL